MSAEGTFLVFCLEMYRAEKNMTGKQVMELFKDYGVIDYILSCYDALHVTGTAFLIEDIDLFIEARKAG